MVRWGILGPGKIAGKFADAVLKASGGKLAAVGSRNLARAEGFARHYGIETAYGSYQELAEDPGVDAIYVASPHPYHAEHAELALSAGKHAVVEKPFTLNAREAQRLVQLAGSKRLFLMEAMWSRFLPSLREFARIAASGEIGEPHLLRASFGFRPPFDPKSRLFDPALGGGALLDVGVYNLALAHLIFGEPGQMASTATLGKTGVDELEAITLRYAGGELADLQSANRVQLDNSAAVFGSDGWMEMTHWHRGGAFTVRRAEQPDRIVPSRDAENGFVHQVEEANRLIAAGALESESMPLDATLSVMRTMDRLRADWGLVYPQEAL